jgi:hypothetical protein
VLVAVALALTLAAQAAPAAPTPAAAQANPAAPAAAAAEVAPAAPAPASSWLTFVEVPVHMAAAGTASKVETTLLTSTGVRVGVVDGAAGGFLGGDVSALVGIEGGGTSEVSVSRVPVQLEGRGLVGSRFRGGLLSVGGYGYAGVGLGVGAVMLTAFDNSAIRPFGQWTARGGGGLEMTLGPASLRVETGLGVRDARLELHGALSLGGRW